MAKRLPRKSPAHPDQGGITPAAAAAVLKPWAYGAPPWEEYSGPGAGAPDAERVVVSLEDLGHGKVAVSSPRPAGLQEQDLFGYGGDTAGSKVIFNAAGWETIVLDEDTKLRAMEQSEKYYREDPIYRGVVTALVNFVIGKGLKFKADDENPQVQDYLEQFWRASGMDGKDTEMVRRWIKSGELCLRFYRQGVNGAGAKLPLVRIIPFWRLAGLAKDPEDAEVVLKFKLYKPTKPEARTVETDEVDAKDVLFWKNASAEEDRGEPPLLVVMRACRWYADWLLNRVVLNRYRTSIVLFKKLVQGTPGQVSSVQSAQPDADNRKGSGGKYEKRLPKAGTVVTHNDKIEYDYKSPQLDAADAKNDGRAILLYICAGAQVPEFILGDASNANLASTLVAESPFVRQVEAYQDFFNGVFAELFKRVIEHGIAVGAIPKMSTETVVAEGNPWLRPVRRLLRRMGLLERVTEQGDAEVVRRVPTKTTVTCDWPSLIHRNQLEEAQTLQIHQGMGLASTETLRGKTGYDHETEERRLDAEAEAARARDPYAADRAKELEDEEEPEGGEPPPKGRTRAPRAAA